MADELPGHAPGPAEDAAAAQSGPEDEGYGEQPPLAAHEATPSADDGLTDEELPAADLGDGDPDGVDLDNQDLGDEDLGGGSLDPPPRRGPALLQRFGTPEPDEPLPPYGPPASPAARRDRPRRCPPVTRMTWGTGRSPMRRRGDFPPGMTMISRTFSRPTLTFPVSRITRLIRMIRRTPMARLILMGRPIRTASRKSIPRTLRFRRCPERRFLLTGMWRRSRSQHHHSASTARS